MHFLKVKFSYKSRFDFEIRLKISQKRNNKYQNINFDCESKFIELKSKFLKGFSSKFYINFYEEFLENWHKGFYKM